jgi:DNA-binding CsgD family transcriptional regulator
MLNVTDLLPKSVRAPSLHRGVTIGEFERHAGADTARYSNTAAITVTRDLAVLHTSRDAELMLQDGGAIRIRAGHLATADQGATERLSELVRGAVDAAMGENGSAGGVLSIPQADRLPVTVLVAAFRPARDRIVPAMPSAILLIRDPECAPMPKASALQGMFRLTPAEAVVASYLARGRSVAEIAARHDLSPNTVRSHLKNIFSKTGVRHQAQLVALVLRSATATARPELHR